MSSVIFGSDHGYGSDEEPDRRSPGLDDLHPPDRYEIFLPAVQSLTNALGGYEEIEVSPGSYETVYRPGDSVLAVLKDLKKLWRKDDEDDERSVARAMAKGGLMKELVGLVVELSDRRDWGRKVSLVACDLIAALTWPIDVQQELKETEDEPDLVTDYASLLRAQLEYKALILQTPALLRSLLALILPSLATPRKDERDEKIISLGLHIVRNLLAIKDAVAEGTSFGEKEEFANLQSKLVIQLDKLTFFGLILTLASCADKIEFTQYNVLVLDILHLTYRGVDARDLCQDQARAPMKNLTRLLDAEKRRKTVHSRAGMTRHSRFGTTVAVKAGDQKLVLHKQNAISVNPGKMLDEIKRKRTGRVKKVDELRRIVNLNPEAMTVLQLLAKNFLQNCFNTFFPSILKDIRMERSKVRDTDNIRTFVLARFFIEVLLILRQKKADRQSKENGHANGHAAVDLSLGLVAELAEMDAVRWVVMRMKYTMEEKPPAWTELQASLDCFTHLLSLIDAMAVSEEEEDVEAAEILQNQLYYNGDILDSALLVISQYKDQSVAYLDSVIHFAYVLLRMLEKYSKTKSFMFVRKRKAARKKRKTEKDPAEEAGPTAEEYADNEEDEGGAERDVASYKDHKFTFEAFERKFACDAVASTLVTYLARFHEFEDPEQMKRVVGLMHRQIVKTQAEGLYFKVSSLNLFRRVLDDQSGLPQTPATKDLLQLINFVLRKFFKKVQEDPYVIVQALGPKTRGHWKELSSYKSDEESDDGMGGQGTRIKEMESAPAEIEFKKKAGLSWSQQMGAVVAMLLQAERRDWIEWIIENLEVVHAARMEVVLRTDGLDGSNREDDGADDENRMRDFSGPSKEAIDKFEQFDLNSDEEGRTLGLAKDAHLRLMLKLLSFERTDDEKAIDQRWFIPPNVLPANLSTSIGALRQYLMSPPSLEDPKTLLRKKGPPCRLSGLLDGSDSEAARPQKRKKKAVETQIFKSAAFIDDSDDDEVADRAFFEKEKALRLEMEGLAERQGKIMRREGGKKRKRGKKENGKDAGGGVDSMIDLEDEDIIMGLDTQISLEVEGSMDVSSEEDIPMRPRDKRTTCSSRSSRAATLESAAADSDLELAPRTQRKARRVFESDEDGE